MSQVKKHFKCFRCHYHNNVKVPNYFKGKKCKKCNSFNYFNYIPNYRKRFGNQNNLFNHQNNYNIYFSNINNSFSDDSFGFNDNLDMLTARTSDLVIGTFPLMNSSSGIPHRILES